MVVLRIFGVFLKLAVLLGLSALLWRITTDTYLARAVHYAVMSEMILLIAGAIAIGIYYWRRFRDKIDDKIDAITGAIFEIITLVENASAAGWRGKKARLDDTTARFAIDGAAKIIEASSLQASISGLDPVPILTAVGEKLAREGNEFALAFIKDRGKIRTGVRILFLLLKMKNVAAAHLALTDFMMQQRDDLTKSGPNFPNLKLFFDFAETWPIGEEPEQCRKRGLSKWDYFVIGWTLRRGRKQIDEALALQTPTPAGHSQQILRGEDAWAALRKFLHVSVEELYESGLETE